MNKELEEAIKRLKSKLKNDGPYIENCNPFSDLVHEIILDNKAIETVLNYIDNSIPKEEVREKIEKIIKTTTPTPIFKPEHDWNIYDCERLYKAQPLYELLEGK